MSIRPVILCGGSGTRLWPDSRKSFPKQFIPMINGVSLFDLTLQRLQNTPTFTTPIIIASKNHAFIVKEAIYKNNLNAKVILEPEGKNTTAAIYLAAKESKKTDHLFIMPSDHLIPELLYFKKVIKEINDLNTLNSWLIFGIKPSIPSEAYGYIQTDKIDGNKLLNVNFFIEKPTKAKAEELLLNNGVFWNAGMFFAHSNTIISSIKKHASKIASSCDIAYSSKIILKNNNYITYRDELFKQIPSKSIDYTIMEVEKNIKLFPLNMKWSDVGSWDAVAEINKIQPSSKKIIQINSKNNFIKNNDKVIATIGIQDLIVINTSNAILIAKKNQTEKVKDIVEYLKDNNMQEAVENTFEKRPWGRFDNLYDSEECKVKRLEIQPFQRLSMQYHNHRSEHWLVVEGQAHVFLDNKTREMNPGESIDIPLGSKHFIENKTKNKLIIIETQLGTYFGEDDIVRLEDPYER